MPFLSFFFIDLSNFGSDEKHFFKNLPIFLAFIFLIFYFSHGFCSLIFHRISPINFLLKVFTINMYFINRNYFVFLRTG